MARGDRRPETAETPETAAPPAEASGSPEASALAELQKRFDALAAEKLLQDAALAEAHEAIERMREVPGRLRAEFEAAWEAREQSLRDECRAFVAAHAIAEALAEAPAPSPKRRRAAATFTFVVDGERKTLRAGDLVPDGLDLSKLPAWATEEA